MACPRASRTVRTGYAYPPRAYRAVRTVATQVIGSANSATWHKKSAEAPEAEQAEPHLLLG